ncbi:MAG TPA: nuclear transport factor 2 family protein [Gemmataceae bacterium]|jgi:beta-aspartyl-peptidase (threonine type)|nr:nuclear transport factor 2 family protein [Gemmataceae bacterium]
MLMPFNPEPVEPSAVEAEIRQLLDNQVAAWNRGDLEGFMDGYWRSPDLSLWSGKERFRGWRFTFDHYRQRYQQDGVPMGHLTLSDLEIDLLSPDSAYVRGRWQVNTDRGSLTGLCTLILKKFAEGWRIVHDHTSG